MNKIGNIFLGLASGIANFYNPRDENNKLKKGRFFVNIALTGAVFALGFGIYAQSKQKNQIIQNVQNNSNFSSTGEFSPANQKKRYNEAVNQANEAQQKYGQKSNQYNEAQQKVGQLQSAQFQVTKPSNPGKSVIQGVQKIISDYGKISNEQLAQEGQKLFYFSSGELKWTYENKLLSLLNVKDGNLGFDLYNGTLYMGFTFNSDAMKQKFETIATIMYNNSDDKPVTKKLSFQYLNN